MRTADLSACSRITRRAALATTGRLVGVACSWPIVSVGQEPAPAGELIQSIERSVIFPGRQGGTTWFHPRPCVIPSKDEAQALMTLQSISGSDVFGPVHETQSSDLGQTWNDPQPVPGLGRQPLDPGWEMGVCDVVPEYHPPTGTVLAVGHNVYYKNNVLAQSQRERWPVYAVRRSEGTWSKPQRLEWDNPRATAIYTNNCAQRVTLPGGDVLLAFSFGPKGRTHRSAAVARCAFDGQTLAVRKIGNELTNTAGRGLLEPSLTSLDGRFYLTLRAEDNRGHVSASDDGQDWTPPRPWCWDDGEPLTMSTTQQHWLPHSDALFLVYTRRAEENKNVFRWRAPLYVAEVDRDTLRLLRATERVVLPLIGDGVNRPQEVARMGNFHTVAATPDESWVTVGETLPANAWRGDTLLARVRWSRPNRLAPQAVG